MSSQKIILLSVLITFAVLLSLAVYINATVPHTAIVSPTLANNSYTGVGYINVNITTNQTIINTTQVSDDTASRTYIVVRNVTGNGGIQNFSNTNLRFNGAGSGSIVNSTFVNVTGLTNGTYEIYYQVNVTASGGAGTVLTNWTNFTRFNYTITIDTAAPTATVNTTFGFNSSDTTPELTFHLQDNVNTSISYRLYVDDTNASVYSTSNNMTTFLQNLSALNNGTHRIRLEGIDSVGRANSSEKNITIDTTSPNITLTTGKTLVDLIGTVTLDCNAADSHTGVNISTIALTVTKPSGGKITAGAGAYSYGSLSGETDEVGIYTASCAASDLIRNNNTASLTFEIKSPSSGTLGTPTPTPANATPVPVKEEKTRSITDASKPTDFIFTKAELPIKQISIDVKTAVDNIKVSAAETAAPTTGAPTASATDKEIVVSKYLELTATNLAADNIEKATIAFKVTKKWLTDNVLTVADVSLQRLVNSAWTKLSTRKTGETETEVSYEADTPGFSTFAIVGEKVKSVPTATPTPSATPAPTTIATPKTSVTASPTPAPKAGMPADIWLYTGIAVAVIIIIVAVVFAVKRKK